jgi:hypothetical protein
LHINCPSGSESHDTTWNKLNLIPKSTTVVGEACCIYAEGSGGNMSAIHNFYNTYLEVGASGNTRGIEIVDSGTSTQFVFSGIHFDGNFDYRVYNHIRDTKLTVIGYASNNYPEDEGTNDRMYQCELTTILARNANSFIKKMRVINPTDYTSSIEIDTDGTYSYIYTATTCRVKRGTGTGYHFEFLNQAGASMGGIRELGAGDGKPTGSMHLPLVDSAGNTTIDLNSRTGRGYVEKLAVGNSAAATTLGSVTKKIQVFDVNGTSLGYIPVYNSIT